ncbi:MAG: NADH-quinone oxidoreductase subunit N [Bacteroidales bacterium]
MYAIITIGIVAIITLLFGAFEKKKAILPIVIVGLIGALVASVFEWNQSLHLFNEMYIGDNFGVAFNVVLILSTLLVFLFASAYYKPVKKPLEDVYSLMLFALAGGLMMTSYGNLVMLFLGIETLSISLYVLAGSKKFDPSSNEAAMKYFLTGSFASGFLLFGIALLYGATGSFNLAEIQAYVLANHTALPAIFVIGFLLLAVGMTFKISAAPFHFWAPDVYEGSPTLITSFMATVGKVAAFAAFYRLINSCFADAEPVWKTTFTVFSIATILIGNFSALSQDNVKRMFAYSGIAHAGYMLIALVALKTSAAGVLLLYSVSYSVATITAFAVLIMVRETTGSFSIKAFNGLAKQNPIAAFAMTLSMLSLAGIPPLVGFSAKFNLFINAFEGGNVVLVIVAVIGSMVSIFYYFKPVVAMYFNTPNEGQVPVIGKEYKIEILIATIVLIATSFIPSLIVKLL